MRMKRWAGALVMLVVVGVLGCASPRSAEQSPDIDPAFVAPPTARVEAEPATPALSDIGVTHAGFRITPPEGHSITTIYRVYRAGVLDERASRAYREFGSEPQAVRMSLGCLNPNRFGPEPSTKIKLLIPGYTAQRGWEEVGGTSNVGLRTEHSEEGPVGREVRIMELDINDPLMEEGDPRRKLPMRDRAPLYVAASYRIDPMTEEQRARVAGNRIVGESVQLRTLPPAGPPQ